MQHFKYIILAALSCLATGRTQATNLDIQGSNREVIEITPEKNTGLDKIYVVYDTTTASAVYTATTGDNVVWYRYSNLGGGYAEEISGIERNGRTTTLKNLQGDMGYIIEEGTNRSYFWVTNYKPHELTLNSVDISDESDCGTVILNVKGSGTPIHYYTINGQQRTLDQEITTTYYTLEYDDESKTYQQIEATKSTDQFEEEIFLLDPPLCDTKFKISGDRFTQIWGYHSEAETGLYDTPSVDCRTYAEQAAHTANDDLASNEITSDSGDLGGSAPADITFYSVTSDAVIHYEWQMATDPDFEDLIYRFNDKDLNYVFREQGTTYVRFIGSNATGDCETYGDTFTVTIGTSVLKCPNAFSPGASEGVNDVWKVSYQSIIEYECHIFNRNGEELFSSKDPSEGWDGKRNGKLVKPGVYFYVINALGSDNKRYKLSGDINIIRYGGRRGNSSSSSTDE